MRYRIIKLAENESLIEQASEWFHQKWKIPKAAYIESMKECVENTHSIPQWYVIMNGGTIIAGLGVIENDFHDRKDLIYLVTDHTSFYERYGWEFLCMVQGDGEPEMTRMYIHQEQ